VDKLKEHIANKTTNEAAFNKTLLKDKEVSERLEEVLSEYANMNLSDLLTLTEFQYLRSVRENKKEIITGDDFNTITTLYTLSNGSVHDIIDIIDEDEYSIKVENRDISVLVSCAPYNFFVQFSNEKGMASIVSCNDHLGEDVSIRISKAEALGESFIIDSFILDSSSKKPTIIRNKEIIPLENEIER